MDADKRRNIQIVMAVVLVIALARAGYVVYQRRQTDAPSKAPVGQRELKSDDFVFLRSLHAYDVASAKKIEGMTVWVKAGNAVAYFKPGNLKNEAGVLPPMAKLKVEKVAVQGDQVMATFTFEEGTNTSAQHGPFVAPVGSVSKGDTNLFLDEMFYYDDPHKLYAHWSPEVWSAVERHEITQGMNENQAGMAMGIGRAAGSSSGDYGNRTLQYTHAGKTVEVTFRGNSAVRVEGKKEQG
jgi:hypothetical protein